MFHPDTQFLIDHWTGLAGRAGVRGGIPDRATLSVDALGLRLPRAFMAERTDDDAVLRVAGGWVESFHGRPLAGESFLGLWRRSSRPMVAAALAQTTREARPVIIAALAGSATAQLEIALTPLRGVGGRPDRILGLMVPAATLTLAADEPRLLTARVTIGVGDPGRPALNLAAVKGRRIA